MTSAAGSAMLRRFYRSSRAPYTHKRRDGPALCSPTTVTDSLNHFQRAVEGAVYHRERSGD